MLGGVGGVGRSLCFIARVLGRRVVRKRIIENNLYTIVMLVVRPLRFGGIAGKVKNYSILYSRT